MAAGAALLWWAAAAGPAQAAVPFRITSLAVHPDRMAVLQWEGANTNLVVQFTADITAPLWQPVPGVEWPIAGTNWSGLVPWAPGKGFLRVVTTEGAGTAPVPLKTISLTLIGWHDAQSNQYMRDCIACHGTRTRERALDGTTPTAHAIMLNEFGTGNSRCLGCHMTGPDFLTGSAGALRKQIFYDQDEFCTDCHSLDLYDR